MVDLLRAGYADLLADDSGYWSGLAQELAGFDRDAFEEFETMGQCVFVTKWGDGSLVGLASFDPRPGPAYGIVGQNCIHPAHRRRGIGRRQIMEIVSRFGNMGIRRAVVSTNAHPFFVPARRNYESCGFTESRRFAGGPDPRYTMIEYVKDLARVFSGCPLEPSALRF